jgi:hypothetical protein
MGDTFLNMSLAGFVLADLAKRLHYFYPSLSFPQLRVTKCPLLSCLFYCLLACLDGFGQLYLLLFAKKLVLLLRTTSYTKVAFPTIFIQDQVRRIHVSQFKNLLSLQHVVINST